MKYLHFISLGVVFVLLISNIFTYLYFTNEMDSLKNGVAIDTYTSSLETSTSSISIHNFSLAQYEQGAIDSKAYTDTLSNLISVHEKLIKISTDKTQTEEIQPIFNELVLLLTARKEAYENLKSAVDLSAENFNTVADNKFKESKQLEAKVKGLIEQYNQSKSK